MALQLGLLLVGLRQPLRHLGVRGVIDDVRLQRNRQIQLPAVLHLQPHLVPQAEARCGSASMLLAWPMLCVAQAQDHTEPFSRAGCVQSASPRPRLPQVHGAREGVVV